MVSLKYVKDYRLDTKTDASGKVKDHMVYIGPYYEWAASEEEFKSIRIKILYSVLIGFLLYISSMLKYSDITRIWFVILPFVCTIFSLFMLGLVSFNLYTIKGKMTREQKCKTLDRAKEFTALGAFLCAISGIASLVCVTGKFINVTFTDAYFVIAQIFLFVIFLYCFKVTKGLSIKEIANPEAEEWKDK